MTQTQKHTPGPWHISPCYFGGVLNHIEINGETDGIAVTKCEANARLIAAAPETAAERDRLKAINAELLAALKDLMWRFNDADPPCNDPDVLQASAAIAKAEEK